MFSSQILNDKLVGDSVENMNLGITRC